MQEIDKELEMIRLSSCINYLSHFISDVDKSNEKAESFHYIPFHFHSFTELLNITKKLIPFDNPKFIDYGCGVGLTVRYAELIGCLPKGIEYNEKFCKNNCLIDFGDLKDPSIFKKDYYHIAYWYSPFKSRSFEIPFEILALQSVRVGGYVICPSPGLAYERCSQPINKFLTPQYKPFYEELKNFKRVKFKEDHSYHPILQRIN